jgi:hypothetical protein
VTSHGRWLDAAHTRFLTPHERTGGARVVLTAPIRYEDAAGVVHTTPGGFAFDGASIPRPLWSVMGAPLEGPYVRSAAQHDFECAIQVAPSRVVHRRFLHALRAEGVGRVRAALMYAAVAAFGPRWTV